MLDRLARVDQEDLGALGADGEVDPDRGGQGDRPRSGGQDDLSGCDSLAVARVARP